MKTNRSLALRRSLISCSLAALVGGGLLFATLPMRRADAQAVPATQPTPPANPGNAPRGGARGQRGGRQGAEAPIGAAPAEAATVGAIGVTKPVPPFMVGADISAVQAYEARGGKFYDGDKEEDIFTILKNHGFNYIRLRIFNDPTKPTPSDGAYSMEGFCDLPHTIEMGKRAKAAGMGLLIDFHYSDAWADPGKQHVPSAWANLSFDDLVKVTHDWTKDCIQKLTDGGAKPDMVQVGNEITPGVMNDHQPEGGGSTRNWDQLAALLKAGIAGVTDVDPKTLIMLHIDKGGDNRTSTRWFDSAISRGVKFDIIGESCYTQWQGQPETWKANFEEMAKRYPHLYFICAETAMEVRQSNDIMHDLADHRGLGTFIWEPTQNGNGQGLFYAAARGGGRRGARRGGAGTNPAAPGVATATPPAPATRPGTVNPDRMGLYDQIVKDYGLKK